MKLSAPEVKWKKLLEHLGFKNCDRTAAEAL
jgi:hypothetical protein